MVSLDDIFELLNNSSYHDTKIARTKKAIEACDGDIYKIRQLIRYTKADQSLLAGKRFGGLLDKKTITEELALLVIEKEFLDSEEPTE